MRGGNHGKPDIAEHHRAALVEPDGLDFFVLLPVTHQIILANYRNPQSARERKHVAYMVKMGMRQYQMRAARDRVIVTFLGEGRIAGKPGIDQENLIPDLDSE